jgi:hypothetical protein
MHAVYVGGEEGASVVFVKAFEVLKTYTLSPFGRNRGAYY